MFKEYNITNFWEAIKKPGVKVVNDHVNLQPDIKALAVLCPLYSPGDLNESHLVCYPNGISDSRVQTKFDAYLATLTDMEKYLNTVGGNLTLNAIFANKGVLVGNPKQSDHDALEWHSELYSNAVTDYCNSVGIACEYKTYDDLDIDFPIFVDMNESVNGKAQGNPSELIELLCELVKVSVTNNKRNRHRVERIMDIDGVGFTGAFWIIAGYLPFDNMIIDLIPDNGAYLAAEKAQSLFGVADLTESLKLIPRIEIEA